ncbi:hypothetical protein C2845_PM06G30820 [Panicum miliaceum]|uniref:Uncharacterized protein n=1 Tax=Panicum miliaceum TaxID=4540 RepID=A0A3L6RAZ1_PANMI|nr:hypothetical protein C2845_PM06G30820 [Panicum miliaceum]
MPTSPSFLDIVSSVLQLPRQQQARRLRALFRHQAARRAPPRRPRWYRTIAPAGRHARPPSLVVRLGGRLGGRRDAAAAIDNLAARCGPQAPPDAGRRTHWPRDTARASGFELRGTIAMRHGASPLIISSGAAAPFHIPRPSSTTPTSGPFLGTPQRSSGGQPLLRLAQGDPDQACPGREPLERTRTSPLLLRRGGGLGTAGAPRKGGGGGRSDRAIARSGTGGGGSRWRGGGTATA